MDFSSSLSLFFRGRLFSFLICAAAITCLYTSAHAQFKFRELPNRVDPEALDPFEGGRVWQQFLTNRALGYFMIEGELVYRPPLDASESYSFFLEGDWSASVERTTLQLRQQDGTSCTWQLLVRAGSVFVAPGELPPDEQEPLAAEDLQSPILDGLPLAWDDLLMPFLQWNTVEYLGPARYLGRPAHRYSLFNPEDGSFPAKVVVTIDQDYAALLEAELFAADETLVKRMRVGGFRKFDEEWMFSSLNWELRPSRESIRLKVLSFSTRRR